LFESPTQLPDPHAASFAQLRTSQQFWLVAMQLSPHTSLPVQAATHAPPSLNWPEAQQIPSEHCFPEGHCASAVQAEQAPAMQAWTLEHATHASRFTPQVATFADPVTKAVPLQQLFAGLLHEPPQQRAPVPPLQVLPLPASVQVRQTFVPVPGSSHTSLERQSVSALHVHLPPAHPKAPQFRQAAPHAVASVAARQIPEHA